MCDFAGVCIVGLVSLVAIVAIFFGRGFTGKVNGHGVEVTVAEPKP